MDFQQRPRRSWSNPVTGRGGRHFHGPRAQFPFAFARWRGGGDGGEAKEIGLGGRIKVKASYGLQVEGGGFCEREGERLLVEDERSQMGYGEI